MSDEPAALPAVVGDPVPAAVPDLGAAGLIVNGSGEVIGFVFCSQGADLALQPNVVPIARDHPAITEPWRWSLVTDAQGQRVPALSQIPRPRSGFGFPA